ncbi:hypothetical protein GCM10017744_060720 [Streptomyces antimycoticus]|uniref:Uncharacterized protein n=1 Tax=Streptomyces antimycoticus TaxID=68175 RepID=A0A4D4K569_9ACTN|nr:hypothetical protein SANT12839_041460 [Streptomyces antimycoticus]
MSLDKRCVERLMHRKDGIRARDLEHSGNDRQHPGQMDAAAFGLGLESCTEKDIEPGGVAELQLRAVHHQPDTSPLYALLERLAQHFGGVVIQLTRRCHDRARPVVPNLDLEPAFAGAADHPAVHLRTSSGVSLLSIARIEPYAFYPVLW